MMTIDDYYIQVGGRVRYDPDTGRFFWMRPIRKEWYGKETAITKSTRNQKLFVRYNNKQLSAHRLAWYCHYGELPGKEFVVYHLNRNLRDNRIKNLALIPNNHKSKLFKSRNKTLSRYKGVTKTAGIPKWRAHITRNYKYYHIGYYDTEAQAYQAYCTKALELDGKIYG